MGISIVSFEVQTLYSKSGSSRPSYPRQAQYSAQYILGCRMCVDEHDVLVRYVPVVS